MVDSRKVTSSKSLVVAECKIIGSNGQTIDLKDPLIFNTIQIYENIYFPVVTGTIQLIEGVNLYSLLSMHGNEYLYISFSRPGESDSDVRYTRTFRIYKSDLRKRHGTSQQQTYVLHFCSNELVYSLQQIISRSLSGLTASEQVYNILINDLQTNKKRVKNLEKSQGLVEYTFTKHKPFEAIEQITKYAYNENNSPFLFFENRDGYNFISLEKLVSQEPVTTLNASLAKFALDSDDSPFVTSNDIKQFEFEQGFNVLEGITNYAFSGRLYTLDLIRQRYDKNNYSALNYQLLPSMLDQYPPFNDAKNRNGQTLYQNYNGFPDYWLTNLNQNETPYFISKNYKVTNTNIERIHMNRKMLLALLENTRISCKISGNPNLSVGYVVNFNMPSYMPNKSETATDPYNSGKYLITHIRHSITPDDMETVMLMNKNSVLTPFDSASNDSRDYTVARDF
jgi:hypothetical protein